MKKVTVSNAEESPEGSVERFLEEDIELRVIHGLMKRVEYETKDDYPRLLGPEMYIGLKDIDWGYAARYCSKMNLKQSCYGSILQNRQFIRFRDGKAYLTALAGRLFSKDRGIGSRSVWISVQCFDGTQMEFDENDNKIQDVVFKGPLPLITKNAADFIAVQLKEYAIRRERTAFEGIPEFPDSAWKELLLNAAVHHTNLSFFSHIFIHMFDDRIEIYNDVSLDSDPNQYVPDGVVNKRAARLYGPLSQTGNLAPFQGLRRVYEQMEKASLPAPEFYLHRRTFCVMLRNRPKPDKE